MKTEKCNSYQRIKISHIVIGVVATIFSMLIGFGMFWFYENHTINGMKAHLEELNVDDYQVVFRSDTQDYIQGTAINAGYLSFGKTDGSTNTIWVSQIVGGNVLWSKENGIFFRLGIANSS